MRFQVSTAIVTGPPWKRSDCGQQLDASEQTSPTFMQICMNVHQHSSDRPCQRRVKRSAVAPEASAKQNGSLPRAAEELLRNLERQQQRQERL